MHAQQQWINALYAFYPAGDAKFFKGIFTAEAQRTQRFKTEMQLFSRLSHAQQHHTSRQMNDQRE
ncbi:MAG: hypothetical protein CMJ19_22775 [Phycisphaeraceae bacterium]|nr:hypothetical protein [Phycisphaeraceae bacterium]